METDFKKLIETLASLKIEFKVVECETMTCGYDGKVTYNKFVTIGNGVGFRAFYTEFYFLDDVFQNHGVWE